MILRPFLYEPTSCASFLFGCTSRSRLAVVDAHAALVDAYLREAERIRGRARRRGAVARVPGDSLLVNDAGRPDLHAGGDPLPLARRLQASL